MFDDFPEFVKLESLPGQLEIPFDAAATEDEPPVSAHKSKVKDSLLTMALQTAVPLWVIEIRYVPFDRRQERAKEISQIVAEKGDIILYRSDKRGETAKAFNALAEGIAILSFAPGGVKAFGCHWEAAEILRRCGLEGVDVGREMPESMVDLEGILEGVL